MNSFRDVIDLWPSMAEMARQAHVTHGTVKQWRRRNSIPSRYWLRLVLLSDLHGYGVSWGRLAEIANVGDR